MVEINKIKKALYIEKPIANLLYIKNGIACYDSTFKIEEKPLIIYKTVFFNIPVSDMGEAEFKPKMDAKLLIRWLTI